MRTAVLGAQAKLCVANRRVGLATAAIAILPISLPPCVPALRSQLFTLHLFARLPVLQVAFLVFMLAGTGLVFLEIYIGDRLSLARSPLLPQCARRQGLGQILACSETEAALDQRRVEA